MKNQTPSDLVTKDFLENALTDVDRKAQSYRDEILTKMDEVIKELEGIREDRELATYQTRELRESVDDHEKRIAKLEKSPQAA